MSRGGYRRRHVPPTLSPAQVLRAAERLAAGFLLKQIYTDLGVSRKTLWRALNGFGSYGGILPGGPCHGHPGSRPLLKPEKVVLAAAQRAAGRRRRQIAADLHVSQSTVCNALNGRGAYATTERKG